MAVNISDLSMCVEVDLAFYPAQHQHSKQLNNSVIEVKVNIPMTNKTVIALETWICSAQTRLCRLNQQGWQGAGLLATAHPATWARLIYGRLTRSLFQRVLALRCHYRVSLKKGTFVIFCLISVLEVGFYFFTCVSESEFWARFI